MHTRTLFSTTGSLLTLVLLAASGCQDKRLDAVPERDRHIVVDAPGAKIDIETPAAPAVMPRAGEGVDVNVGPGGAQVDVEGTPLRDRLRERREEKAAEAPQ